MSLLAKTKDPDLQGYREEHPWFPCCIAEVLIQIQFKPRILKPYEGYCHEGDPNPDDTDVQLWRKKLMSRVVRTPPRPLTTKLYTVTTKRKTNKQWIQEEETNKKLK